MRTLFRRYAVFALVFAVLASALMPSPGLAVEPHEMLADPKLEARARNLSLHLRCLVCQNQSIDDSNADLARDLRVLVRERLVAGDSDEEVKDFVVRRYGTFVLLKPPFEKDTLLLWLAPALVLAAAGMLIGRRLLSARSVQPAQPGPLTEEEQEKLQRILTEYGVDDRRQQ
jgi:cytochrome c-type biogenesis protein CcmH